MNGRERCTVPAWTNLQPSVNEIMKQYLADHHMTVSEFVRACIIGRLLDKEYISQEVLEQLVA